METGRKARGVSSLKTVLNISVDVFDQFKGKRLKILLHKLVDFKFQPHQTKNMFVTLINGKGPKLNMEEVLQYSLTPVPWLLCHPDETMPDKRKADQFMQSRNY